MVAALPKNKTKQKIKTLWAKLLLSVGLCCQVGMLEQTDGDLLGGWGEGITSPLPYLGTAGLYSKDAGTWENTSDQDQQTSCKGPDSKYFRPGEPYNPCHTCSIQTSHAPGKPCLFPAYTGFTFCHPPLPTSFNPHSLNLTSSFFSFSS